MALAAELNRRGYRVMTVKHGHGFQVDQPGRDSWRHRHEGGALRTVLAGPGDFAVIGSWPEEEMPLPEMVRRFLWDADIVLAEGFKRAPEPKVEVFRAGAGSGPPDVLIGRTSPDREPSPWSPMIRSHRAPMPVLLMSDPDHVPELADLLEERFMGDRGGLGEERRTVTTAPLPRAVWFLSMLSGLDHRRDDPGEQPGELEPCLCPSPSRRVARVDAHGPHLPLLPLHRGCGRSLLLREAANRGDSRRDLFLHIVRRSVILFGLGLFMAAFPRFDLETCGSWGSFSGSGLSTSPRPPPSCFWAGGEGSCLP